MFKMSWVRGAGAAAALAAAAAAAPALATPVVVDFETGFEVLGSGETYTESGFGFTAVGAGAFIDPSFCDPVLEFCAVGNSSSFLTALNDTSIRMAHASRHFLLGSFTAAYVPTPLADLSGSQIKLQLNGTSAAGAAVSASVNLLEDGSTGNWLFSMYDASALGYLRSLNFSVCFDDGVQCGAPAFQNDAQFALDDLSLQVPEPGAAALVALALAGLALTRRRSR